VHLLMGMLRGTAAGCGLAYCCNCNRWETKGSTCCDDERNCEFTRDSTERGGNLMQVITTKGR
jgi:hypothetical protein